MTAVTAGRIRWRRSRDVPVRVDIAGKTAGQSCERKVNLMTTDAKLRVELAAINRGLQDIEAMARVLLAFRLHKDGHAKTFREATKLARNLDAVKALYPMDFD